MSPQWATAPGSHRPSGRNTFSWSRGPRKVSGPIFRTSGEATTQRRCRFYAHWISRKRVPAHQTPARDLPMKFTAVVADGRAGRLKLLRECAAEFGERALPKMSAREAP